MRSLGSTPSKNDARSDLDAGQIVGGGLTCPLVLDDFVIHFLTFIQAIEARTLDGGNVDENVRTTLIRLNEAISLLAVEPFNGASCHNARSLVQSLLVAVPSVHPAEPS